MGDRAPGQGGPAPAVPVTDPLLQLFHFLRHDLHQAHLDHMDAPTLMALRAQFHHWALGCDESYRRPKGRSLAKSAPPVPAFTLAPPRAA